MTDLALMTINRYMEELDLPYEYSLWTGEVRFPMVIGEELSDGYGDDSGREESTFILTIIGNQSSYELKQIKNKIKDFFKVTGKRSMEQGTLIVIAYDSSFLVPTQEEGLKKLQVNLSIKEWRNSL